VSPSVVHKVETAPADPMNGGPELHEQSRRLVQLMRRDAGRGPTLARCHYGKLFVFEPPTDRREDERFAKADFGIAPESAGAARL
jgi:hypothetical protein